MKDEALEMARASPDPAQRLNILREYLQACVLQSLHESEAFLCLSFVGGTALRFLHRLPRFSEDLDFSLESHEGYKPVRWLEKMKRDLAAAGFDLAVQWNDRKTVHTAWIRFAGLLKEAGLSAMAAQKLSVKIEVDTRTPEGAVSSVDIVHRHKIFSVRHHDKASLFAGKLHAVLTRKYAKGRDLYDLLWYLSDPDWPPPNLVLLNNALAQSGWTKDSLREDTWRPAVAERLKTINWKQIRADVAPFLERPRDAALLEPETFARLLGGK